MGFFKKIFGASWRKYKQRGDTYFEGGEWGRARAEYNAALAAFDEGSEVDQNPLSGIRERLKVVNRKLLDMHLREADGFESRGMVIRAAEHLRTAMEFIEEAEQREEVLTRIGALEHHDEPPEEMRGLEKKAGPGPARDDIDPEFEREMAFSALLAAMDDEQADVYEALGPRFRAGFLALMDGRLDDAEDNLPALMEEAEDNGWILFEVGRLRLAQEKFEEAEGLLRRAAELLPDSLTVLHSLIHTLWGLENFEQAERVMERAFEIDDTNINNFAYAGETCLRSGEFENGVEILEAGIEEHERSVVLYRLLGKLHGASGNEVAALEAFESALGLRWVYDYETGQLEFDRESAFLAAGLYLSTATNVSRSEELFRSLLATGDEVNRPAFLSGAARAMLAQGQTAQAQTFLVDAASLLPEESDDRKILEKLLAEL